MWRTRLTDCLRIFTGCRGRSLRIVCGFLPAVVDEAYGFLPDVGDEAYGLFTDLHRIWGRRLADCLWIWGRRLADFYRMWRTKLTECFRIFTGCKGRSLYELFAHFYRMWWTRLTGCLRIFTRCGGRGFTDCLQICTGFGGAGLRIVYGFGPDLGEKAYGSFTDFYWMWRTKLTECFRIFTGCKGRSLRIVCEFLPDVVDEAYGLFTDFYRMWGTKLADCYGFGPDLGEKAYGEKAYGFGEVWVLEPWSNSQLQLVLKSIGIHTARTYSFLFPLQNRCKGTHCLLSLDPSNELTWATLGWDGYIDDLIVQVFFISHWLCFDLDLLSTAVSNCCRIVLRPQKPICWLSDDLNEWSTNVWCH